MPAPSSECLLSTFIHPKHSSVLSPQKSQNKNTPKQPTKQTNQLLDTNSAVLSLPNPYQAGIAAFSLPQAGTEKSFVLDWLRFSLSVGDLLQISPCSFPAVTHPFLATKPQMHPRHVTGSGTRHSKASASKQGGGSGAQKPLNSKAEL